MKPSERKAKIKELYKEHAEYFRLNDIVDPIYIPKMAYRHGDKDEKFIALFASELEHTNDMYTEFVSKEYESEDPKRTLYKINYNPHWLEEYEISTSSSGFKRHMIPIAELKVINDITSRNAPKITEVKDFGLMNPDQDCTLSNVTLKDIAALWFKQPISDKKWLNKIISTHK